MSGNCFSRLGTRSVPKNGRQPHLRCGQSRYFSPSGEEPMLMSLRRARLSLLIVVLLITAGASIATWAVKEASKPGVDLSGQQDERDIDKAALTYFQRLAVPDQARPLDLSPIGSFT